VNRNSRSIRGRLLAIVALAFAASLPSQAQTLLTRHVREAARSGEARLVGTLSEHQVLRLDLVLPLRDQAGLDKLMTEMNHTHPGHLHYLTPQEFTERFGPTQEDYDAVVRYAENHGLKVVGGSRDRHEVQAQGEVRNIESAFHVNLLTYQHPTEERTFYAPDREPTTDLPFALWHIAGLDNYSIPHPGYVRGSESVQVSDSSSPWTVATGSGPEGSFLGSDMRAAYYGGTALRGKGQTLGLFEMAGIDLNDLRTYFKNTNQSNDVIPKLISTDGATTLCVYAVDGCDDFEQTLDMIEALGMAPGLKNLQVFVGNSSTSVLSAMTTQNPLPSVISCSWYWIPADPTEADPYFEQMRAQGQTFFAASGDSGTWGLLNQIAYPAEDAWVVSVGGTYLVAIGPGGAWQSETAWGSSGGGISIDGIPLPPYQWFVPNALNQASTTLRNGPDVSANAKHTFYVCADQTCSTEGGGTSFAAPIWAGYAALANEKIVQEGGSPGLGMVNFLFYWWAQWSGNYNNYFHDITEGAAGSYFALPGYDLVTGWGSPNGEALIDFLAGMTTGQIQ
jgi:subtilase family serine protease